MKIGLIMPVACRQPMQEECWTAAAVNKRPDTPFYVLFNGLDQWCDLPHNVVSLQEPAEHTDEADLWWRCVTLASDKGWDWVTIIHDDFKICVPGWEDWIENSRGKRVALAAWCAYAAWTIEGNGSFSPHLTPDENGASQIGVVLDSMGWAIHVPTFMERGCVTEERFGFGFGAWDACGWALEHGYAIWRIRGESWHHWKPNQNTRAMMSRGANGHPRIVTKYVGRSLPASVVNDDTIEVCGKRYSI